jgi:hypothetical protein
MSGYVKKYLVLWLFLLCFFPSITQAGKGIPMVPAASGTEVEPAGGYGLSTSGSVIVGTTYSSSVCVSGNCFGGISSGVSSPVVNIYYPTAEIPSAHGMVLYSRGTVCTSVTAASEACTTTEFDTDDDIDRELDVYTNTGNIRDIEILGDEIIIANGYRGVDRVATTDLTTLVSTDAQDIAGAGLETYAVEADATYVYAVNRSSGADYSEPTFTGSFDEGDTDLSDGSTVWDGGAASESGISITGNATPFWGDYAANVTWTTGETNALVYEGITGGTDNYVSFWVRVNSLTGSGTAQLRVLAIDTDYVFRLIITPEAEHFTMSGTCVHAGGNQAVAGSTEFQYATWYQIKIHQKIDASVGGAQYWYRENFGDSFTSEASNFTLNTSAQTPNRVYAGVQYTSSTLTAGDIDFDHVFVNVDETLETDCWDDGEIYILDATDLTTTIDSLGMEAKFSDLVVDGNYIYVSAQKRGLVVFDISTPSNIQYLSSYDVGEHETQGLVKVGDYIYLANYTYGLEVIDVSNPAAPALVDTLDFTDTDFKLWGLAYSADYAGYLFGTVMCTSGAISESDDGRGLVVYDISNSASISFATVAENTGELPAAAKCDDNGSDLQPIRIAVNGRFAYLANGEEGGYGRIAVYDIRTPTAPAFLRNMALSADAAVSAVAVKDGPCKPIIFSGDGPRSAGGDDNLYVNEAVRLTEGQGRVAMGH